MIEYVAVAVAVAVAALLALPFGVVAVAAVFAALLTLLHVAVAAVFAAAIITGAAIKIAWEAAGDACTRIVHGKRALRRREALRDLRDVRAARAARARLPQADIVRNYELMSAERRIRETLATDRDAGHEPWTGRWARLRRKAKDE